MTYEEQLDNMSDEEFAAHKAEIAKEELKRGNEEEVYIQKPAVGYGRALYKAVIQKHRHTGEQRVFFMKRINGIRRVCTKNHPLGQLKVTNYSSLQNAVNNLTNTIKVGWDEVLLWNGENCERYFK